jgi:carbonic anhydrase/acetyltransferase-like protein (isoleucine patch superfamily)
LKCYRIAEREPRIAPDTFIAPSAEIIGDVRIDSRASIWFGAVLRADTELVVVGRESNIQDGAVLHSDPGFPCILEAQVTIGHRAVVHGATIGAGALVGIGAVVLNGARIGAGSVIGAGAVVAPGSDIPSGVLAMGIPAKVIRPVEPPDNAGRYAELAQRYLKEFVLIPAESMMSRPWQLTLRGEDALNPFTDVRLALKLRHPDALNLLVELKAGKNPREAARALGLDETALLRAMDQLLESGLIH